MVVKALRTDRSTTSRSEDDGSLGMGALQTSAVKARLSHLNMKKNMHFETKGNVFKLTMILLLSGDISENPGPVPSFRLAFTNVLSIKKRFASLELFVDSFKPDVFALNETWLTGSETENTIRSLTPKGYTFHHKPRVWWRCLYSKQKHS